MLLKPVSTVENLKADITGDATLEVFALHVFPQVIGVFNTVITLGALPHFQA